AHAIRLAPLDPLILTQSRNTFAAAILLALLLLQRRRLSVHRGDLLRALLLGAIGVSAANYFYYLAIARTNVATAIMLQYTTPIWIVLYLVARGRQRVTAARLGAVALALTGIALVLGFLRPGGALRLDPIGVTAALLAAFGYAYYILAGESLSRRVDPVLVSLFMLLGAAGLWLLINPPWNVWQAHYSSAQWLFMLGFSLLATLAPTLLYISGLKYLDATPAVITSCLEPVVGILLAAIFLDERLGWSQAMGVACVLAAIVLVQHTAAAPAASVHSVHTNHQR
ncbi:MAG: DMT family transporter, partial [Terriglobales bacterium]